MTSTLPNNLSVSAFCSYHGGNLQAAKEIFVFLEVRHNFIVVEEDHRPQGVLCGFVESPGKNGVFQVFDAVSLMNLADNVRVLDGNHHFQIRLLQ